MVENFHESYAKGQVSPPSDRATGLVFAFVAVIVALLWRDSGTVPWLALGLAAVLTIVSLVLPGLLMPLNILWFKLGLLLHRIVNPVVMFAIFLFVFVPAGLIMRIWHDPLRSRRQPTGSSYWIARSDTAAAPSMANQF